MGEDEKMRGVKEEKLLLRQQGRGQNKKRENSSSPKVQL